jgi:hypothetical protein
LLTTSPPAILLRLNLELAVVESKVQAITPPGLPAIISIAECFATADCIQIL